MSENWFRPTRLKNEEQGENWMIIFITFYSSKCFLFICSSFVEEYLQHFVESMATRTNVVLKAKGDPTWY